MPKVLTSKEYKAKKNKSRAKKPEEEQIKNALDTSSDVVQKFMDMVSDLNVNVDKVKILDYFNKKLLKLNDFNIDKFIIKDTAGTIPAMETPQEPVEEEQAELIADNIGKEFYSYLPINEAVTSTLSSVDEKAWDAIYKDKKIKIAVEKNK